MKLRRELNLSPAHTPHTPAQSEHSKVETARKQQQEVARLRDAAEERCAELAAELDVASAERDKAEARLAELEPHAEVRGGYSTIAHAHHTACPSSPNHTPNHTHARHAQALAARLCELEASLARKADALGLAQASLTETEGRLYDEVGGC